MVQMRMKMLFFETPRVQGDADGATWRALSKAGAFIRAGAANEVATKDENAPC